MAAKGLLRRPAENRHEPETVPPVVYEVLKSPGRPLEKKTRAFFEPRFGHDFSRVQVHTNERAEESATGLDALAYTVRSNVVFAAGKYAPYTQEGKQLLAHELAHIVRYERGLTAESHLWRQPRSSHPTTRSHETQQASRPKELDDEQLETYAKQLYEELRQSGNRGEHSALLDQAIKELVTRAMSRARSLEEKEVSQVSNAFMKRFLAAPAGSGERMISDLYWHVYNLETLRCQRLSVMGFSLEKVKAFQAAAPRLVRLGDQQCLETFIHHLETLYSKEELNSVATVALVRRVLAVNNIFKKLEAFSPRGVEEQAILKGAAAQGISDEQAHEALLTMQAQNVVIWQSKRWVSTGEPFRGLLDTAMAAFTAEHQKRTAAELYGREMEVPIKPMAGITLKTVGRDKTKASQDLAQQILDTVQGYLQPVRPGHFFFGLSLHRGYHSVMLHAEIAYDLTLKLFWKDQEHGGIERPCTKKTLLAAEIEGFWPSYWPESSTLWPLLPSPKQETVAEPK